MEYRREIDGLRALAVVPVILFHAGFQSFSGGFVGVDVFFVISGYLITTIILAEQSAGTFSIINFYERRARRILPALFVVMFACLPFAWLWLLPEDRRTFSQSLVAVPTFVSNNLFWRQSGYFATSAELNPLLHTWSLAVEEQYYVLFPIFLMLTWRLGKRWTLAILGLVAVVSLALAQWGAINRPEFTFFMLPTRGWELLVGAFIAFYFANKNTQSVNQTVSQLVSATGLLLIFFAIFNFDKNTPFPSVYTLVPTLGAALIILFATQQTFVGKLLGTKAFVGVGLISYSTYLWHQPLLSFARHKSIAELDNWLLAALCISSFVLAYLSWRYVETPFRNKKQFSRKNVFTYGVVGSFAFVALGLFGVFNHGYTHLLTENQRRLLAFNSYPFKDIYRDDLCVLRKEQSFKDFANKCMAPDNQNAILIWGDSHAAALSFGLRNSNPNVIQYTANSCPPLLGEVISARPMCKEVNDFVAKQIETYKPKQIFLHANWPKYQEQNPTLKIQKTIDFIRLKSPSSQITIIGGVPQYQQRLPTFMFSNGKGLEKNIFLESYMYAELLILDAKFNELAERNSVKFYSPLNTLCRDKVCQATAEYNGEIMPTAWDNAHLTAAGSMLLVNQMNPK
ncbi:MAG: acyltransferase family protein [Methylobacter sp.]